MEDTILNSEYITQIIENHFANPISIIEHQIQSYNEFVQRDIPRILSEEPEIIVLPKKNQKYVVSFGQTHLQTACVIEDRKLQTIYPKDARNKNLDYCAPLYVDITETLYEKDDIIDTKVHRRVPICRIPVMISSCACSLTKLTYTERMNAGECFKDPGGYFIIKGVERVLIGQVRNAYNEIITGPYKNSTDSKFNYAARIRSMSEQTGHSVQIIAKMGTDKRTIAFTIPYITKSINAGIILKALGFTEEEDIKNLIGLDDIKTNEYVTYILRDSYFVQTKEEALDYMKQFILHTNPKEKQIKYVEQVLGSELFPHMGVTSTPKEKAIYIGHMINKLISTYVGLREEDSKDNYGNKRIETSGILLSELFRTLFKRYTKTLTEQLKKRQDIIFQIQKNTSLSTGLKQSMTSSNWGVPKNTYIRTGVSQVLSRLSYQAFISHLRRIGINVGKSDKNVKLRQIHESQFGAICPTETPEGQPVGTVLSLTMCAKITKRIPTVIIQNILETCDSIIDVDDLEFHEFKLYTKIFLNGNIIGYTESYVDLIKEVKLLRDSDLLDENVSIRYEDIDNEIHILSDEGRIIRPLFPVDEGKLRITKADGIDWDILNRNRKITYIDVAENQSVNIAMYPSEVDIDHDYCEIDPSLMFGVCASCIPFPDHNPAPRNCFQSSMGKQAMGVPVSSFHTRADTILHILSYPQKAFVNPRMATYIGMNDMPAGINAIVAILTYSGYNQEDSIILNKSSIDRGMFIAYTYKTIVGESKKSKNNYNSESIEYPSTDIQRKEWNYSYLDKTTGIINTRIKVTREDGSEYYPEVKVKKGDVIIGKVITEGNKGGEEVKKDYSYVIKSGEEGVVDHVITSKTPGGYTLIKVVIRTERIPEVGDKFAARSAQKGTVGIILSQEDMPFTEEGIVPDIIINPHCIPSRMTIGQLLECVLSKCGAIDGYFSDATPFGENSTDIVSSVCDRLGGLGYEKTGTEIMYNGLTGERFNSRVFIGPTHYQRLKHLVSDKMHARAGGKRTIMHHQPLEGRSKDGGLRFGEMERDAMIAHGASAMIKDRLFDVSDPYTVIICNKCGQITKTANECVVCNEDEITEVNLPYAAKQLVHSLQAMGIKMSIIPK